MDGVAGNLIVAVLHGGYAGVIAVLLLAVMFMAWAIRDLLRYGARREARMDNLMQQHHQSQMTLATALDGLKLVLLQVRDKL